MLVVFLAFCVLSAAAGLSRILRAVCCYWWRVLQSACCRLLLLLVFLAFCVPSAAAAGGVAHILCGPGGCCRWRVSHSTSHRLLLPLMVFLAFCMGETLFAGVPLPGPSSPESHFAGDPFRRESRFAGIPFRRSPVSPGPVSPGPIFAVLRQRRLGDRGKCLFGGAW